MNEWLARSLRELFRGPDLIRARKAEAHALTLAAQGTFHPALASELARLERAPSIRLGRLADGVASGRSLLVDPRELLTHMLVLGASGSGKTFFALNAAIKLFPILGAFVLLDLKGEAAALVTDSILPGIASTLPASERDAFLDRIVVIDPFSPDYLPPLNVLRRDPTLPIEIQARDVAECFETATETDVSTRMETVLDWTLRLVIEVGGSFEAVRRALQESALMEALVRQSSNPDVVRYFLTRYPSEPKASKLALLSRLDKFLALPVTRLCLGAHSCLDFDALLEGRIVVINLGRAPAGVASISRFFAMVIVSRFVRAIFRRSPRMQGRHVVLLADEWQLALTSSLAAEFESILALTRSRNVHLWLANQQLSQLDRHGSSLRAVVLGQTANQVAFRLANEDARSLRGLFPTTGILPRTNRSPWESHSGSAYLSASEEVEARANAACRLPDRVGYWSDRRKPWGSLLLRSATLDVPDPKTLPRDIIDRASRGSIAFTHVDLERMRRVEEQRLDQLAAGGRFLTAQFPKLPAPTPRAQATASQAVTPVAPLRVPAAPAKRRRPRRGVPNI